MKIAKSLLSVCLFLSIGLFAASPGYPHNLWINAVDYNPVLRPRTGAQTKIYFCEVSATYVGFSTKEDYAFSNKTDFNGRSTIRLISPGQWIVRAVVRKPAEAALRDKCLEEKYSATISFEVQ